MALEKLKIKIEEIPDDFETEIQVVMFNPQQITIQKSAWKPAESSSLPTATIDQPKTLDIDLFFDTTLSKTNSSFSIKRLEHSFKPTFLQDFTPEDVQKYTKPIFDLTQKQEGKERPPRCKILWGKKTLLSMGILTDVTETLTHFWQDGTPVRATLSCKFQEWESSIFQQKAANLPDDPTRIVKRGETLSSIAAEEYGDPSQWRIIARENYLTNPRQLVPGQILTIPPSP